MNSTNQSKHAVIYCRVSTKEQVDEGSSLSTQDKICGEYAAKHGFEVIKTFVEQGESAKTANRTELQKMLKFCADKRNQVSAVIVYKLDRLSRNTDDYSQLRLLLKAYNVEIKSTSEFFEDTPAGKFIENMIANVAQFDNDVRSERCAGGMREAVRAGRYVWKAAVGYSNVRVAGKATIAPNKVAPLVLKAFELMGEGTYSMEEVRQAMDKKGLKNPAGNTISKSWFGDMLKNKIYMGQIEKFGECHTGLFEPIVSKELFEVVQRNLKNKNRKKPPFKLDHPDFPLRRFVTHATGKKLTGSWSKGRSKNYAFYRFGMKGTNYQRELLEKQFTNFMDQYSLDARLTEKLKTLVKQKFSTATAQSRKEVERLKLRLEELEKQQTTLVQKSLNGFVTDQVLKSQLGLMQTERHDIQTILTNTKETGFNVDEAITFAEEYLSSPSTTWKKTDITTKVKLQWFQFPQGTTYDGQKFGTAEIANVFKIKSMFLQNATGVVVFV